MVPQVVRVLGGVKNRGGGQRSVGVKTRGGGQMSAAGRETMLGVSELYFFPFKLFVFIDIHDCFSRLL